jgi:hypothetical protein
MLSFYRRSFNISNQFFQKFDIHSIISKELSEKQKNGIPLDDMSKQLLAAHDNIKLQLLAAKNSAMSRDAILQRQNWASWGQAGAGLLGALAIAFFSWLSFEKGKSSDHFKWIYDHHFGLTTHGESSKAMHELIELTTSYDNICKDNKTTVAKAFGEKNYDIIPVEIWEAINQKRSITKDYFEGAKIINTSVNELRFAKQVRKVLEELNADDGTHHQRKIRYLKYSLPLTEELENNIKLTKTPMEE